MTRLQILQFLTSVAFGVIAMKHMWERLSVSFECWMFHTNPSTWRNSQASFPGGSIWKQMCWPNHNVGGILNSISMYFCMEGMTNDRMLCEHHDYINGFEVNLAFNVTLLWQFVGVLFTPAWGPRDEKDNRKEGEKKRTYQYHQYHQYHPFAVQARAGSSSPIKRE